MSIRVIPIDAPTRISAVITTVPTKPATSACHQNMSYPLFGFLLGKSDAASGRTIPRESVAPRDASERRLTFFRPSDERC
jgi:hypothetical protein